MRRPWPSRGCHIKGEKLNSMSLFIWSNVFSQSEKKSKLNLFLFSAISLKLNSASSHYLLLNPPCVSNKNVSDCSFHFSFNPLAPNDVYIRRTAQLTSRRCILNIYSTNILTEILNKLHILRFFLFKVPFISYCYLFWFL